MERTEKQYKVYSWDDTHLGWWYEGDMHAVSEAEAINRFIYIGMPVLRTERKRFEFKAVLSTEEITETEEEKARHQKAYDEREAKRRYLTKEQIEKFVLFKRKIKDYTGVCLTKEVTAEIKQETEKAYYCYFNFYHKVGYKDDGEAIYDKCTEWYWVAKSVIA